MAPAAGGAAHTRSLAHVSTSSHPHTRPPLPANQLLYRHRSHILKKKKKSVFIFSFWNKKMITSDESQYTRALTFQKIYTATAPSPPRPPSLTTRSPDTLRMHMVSGCQWVTFGGGVGGGEVGGGACLRQWDWSSLQWGSINFPHRHVHTHTHTQARQHDQAVDSGAFFPFFLSL